jgi:hypothetical protein
MIVSSKADNVIDTISEEPKNGGRSVQRKAARFDCLASRRRSKPIRPRGHVAFDERDAPNYTRHVDTLGFTLPQTRLLAAAADPDRSKSSRLQFIEIAKRMDPSGRRCICRPSKILIRGRFRNRQLKKGGEVCRVARQAASLLGR